MDGKSMNMNTTMIIITIMMIKMTMTSTMTINTNTNINTKQRKIINIGMKLMRNTSTMTIMITIMTMIININTATSTTGSTIKNMKSTTNIHTPKSIITMERMITGVSQKPMAGLDLILISGNKLVPFNPNHNNHASSKTIHEKIIIIPFAKSTNILN